LLLSLILLSCMVVSSRDLANILFPLSSNLQNYQQEHSLTQQIDININMSGYQSISLSLKRPRESSVHSDI